MSDNKQTLCNVSICRIIHVTALWTCKCSHNSHFSEVSTLSLSFLKKKHIINLWGQKYIQQLWMMPFGAVRKSACRSSLAVLTPNHPLSESD